MTTPGDRSEPSADKAEQNFAGAKEVTENARKAVIEGLEESAKAARALRDRLAAGDTDAGNLVKMGLLPDKPAIFDSSKPEAKPADPAAKAEAPAAALDFLPDLAKNLFSRNAGDLLASNPLLGEHTLQRGPRTGANGHSDHKEGPHKPLERADAHKPAPAGNTHAEKKAKEKPKAGDKAPDKTAEKTPDKTAEKPSDPEVVKKALKEFDDGEHWYKADDVDKMNKALAGKSPQQLNAMEEAFKKEHDGKSIEDYLRDRWKDHPEELKKALDSLQAGKGREVDDGSVKQAAKQIDGAMNALSSDNYKSVVSALENRSPQELTAIKEAFKKDHDGKDMDEYLKDRWKEHPDQLKTVMQLLHPNEKIADPVVVHNALKEFNDGQHALKSDEFDKMNKALADKSPEDLKEMKEAFKKDHNKQSIEDFLRDRWKDHPEELKKALDSLQAGKGKEVDDASVKQAAKQIDG